MLAFPGLFYSIKLEAPGKQILSIAQHLHPLAPHFFLDLGHYPSLPHTVLTSSLALFCPPTVLLLLLMLLLSHKWLVYIFCFCHSWQCSGATFSQLLGIEDTPRIIWKDLAVSGIEPWTSCMPSRCSSPDLSDLLTIHAPSCIFHLEPICNSRLAISSLARAPNSSATTHRHVLVNCEMLWNYFHVIINVCQWSFFFK